MIWIPVGKPLWNSAGLGSTDCPAEHDSADWTLNSRAAVVQSAGKRPHARGAAPHTAAEWDIAEPGGHGPVESELCAVRCGRVMVIVWVCARVRHADTCTPAMEMFYHTRHSGEHRRPCRHCAHAPFAGVPPVDRSRSATLAAPLWTRSFLLTAMVVYSHAKCSYSRFIGYTPMQSIIAIQNDVQIMDVWLTTLLVMCQFVWFTMGRRAILGLQYIWLCIMSS